ncbi:MAG: phosphoribosylaminoimidazolesuccinocarboxamide synthase [Sphingobacteriales bacterium]|jgi:phosphoribosylaminoimidazole-succinocarboxamide synthase|nr:phosphoribosylaminoimidazolesuccinocarboxamide synthase [Sphingobacteriales bacterium]
MEALVSTHFNFNGQVNFYKGKVRDVYNINNTYLAMVACDRISAFDVVLPKPIPFKGQVLNQIAAHFLELTKDIVPNWLIACPDPNVSIGHCCEPFKVEMVIRGYLAGHAWREYKSGKRLICGVNMPDGLRENDPFPEPIITPTIKASEGHDEDITREEIIASGLVKESEYIQLENYTRKLFAFGSNYALKQGLILVDTKYEFGKFGNTLMLMDEIHTPDSSRYFYSDTYEQIQAKDQQQRQLSKEFVRQYLIENGFQGLDGQQAPIFTEEFIQLVSTRYIELFEKITGKTFEPQDYSNTLIRVENNLASALSKLS